MPDQFTDGKILDWPCNVAIEGCREQGYDLQTAAYTDEQDNSAPHEIAMHIENCQGSFMTFKAAQNYAIKCGFVMDQTWGWMKT